MSVEVLITLVIMLVKRSRPFPNLKHIMSLGVRLLVPAFISVLLMLTGIKASTFDQRASGQYIKEPRSTQKPSSQIEEDFTDPIISFRVVHPRNGSVVKLPLKVRLEVGLTNIAHYTSHYAGIQVCIEILDTVTKCAPILDAHIEFNELPKGQHTTRAFITNNDRTTDAVSFFIMDKDNYAVYTTNVVEHSRKNLQLPKDINLLEWAQEQHNANDTFDIANVSDPFLVIGVKTAVLSNFARRQAIRETWGQRAKQFHIKVLFVGCVPITSDMRLQNAVTMEKKVYRDLLTEELDCEDSYFGLAEKVKAFVHLAATAFSQTSYVMIVDDDVFVQVEKLVNMLNELKEAKRVYLGQSWSSTFSSMSTPIRDETHKNYLPTDQYPLSELPPFAFGPHYVISMDCARFISKNFWRLQSLNGLEDVSVGLWMLAMQVHLRHTQQFSHLTFQPCENTLISFAELSPLGIRAIYANLLHDKEPCHGYDRIAWNS